mmetsp:Transcript_1248/g.2298  ORF Transcript_1248/g.2298 Transcript_1248/m.2298 type:complete len:137 (+) Transcript_1248:276-686(+)
MLELAIFAGPPRPSQYWQADLVVQGQTPQLTMFAGHHPAPEDEGALWLAPEELPMDAGPPLPSHHWHAPGSAHLQTPQSTKPAMPQEARWREPVPRSVEFSTWCFVKVGVSGSAEDAQIAVRATRKANIMATDWAK